MSDIGTPWAGKHSTFLSEPYWFQLPAERGEGSKFHFPTYRLARASSLRNGSPAIWFTDSSGRHRRCTDVLFQEATE
ncbi:hypothetical protein [Plantibacter sp. M259]|uniref:hypothetical protein n=1 Tax=Plantibacter sp. M259 TaxID=2583822 RepID=UPI00111006C4|nr:hypothetical protein [Plantibacter sp. M259]